MPSPIRLSAHSGILGIRHGWAARRPSRPTPRLASACYTHIKDAVYDESHPQAMSDGWRYVACGEGTVPLAEAIAILQQGGYTGYLVFEHEKKWHPELPEPEEILPKFTAWARRGSPQPARACGMIV